MTGRDLIIYILENKLEDTPMFENGKLLGFMDVHEAAVKLNVGPATIKTWFDLEAIPGIKIGEEIYIPVNIESKDILRSFIV